MNRRLLLSITLGILALGAIIAVGLASRVPTAVTRPTHVATLRPGDPAPPFQVGFFDSSTVKQPILLELFATWCPHCRREVPILNAIYQKYGSRVTVIAVSSHSLGQDEQSPETQADVMAFAQALNVQYPIVFDPDLNVANLYMLQGFPTIVVIDANKKISTITSGDQTKAQLERRLRAVL